MKYLPAIAITSVAVFPDLNYIHLSISKSVTQVHKRERVCVCVSAAHLGSRPKIYFSSPINMLKAIDWKSLTTAHPLYSLNTSHFAFAFYHLAYERV